MRAIVLADGVAHGARIWRALAREPGVEARVLVTRPPAEPLARYVVRQLRELAGARPRALAATRVSTRHLHDRRVVDSLRRRAADVGLHAAGVIYRQPLLDSFRLGILNAHIGLLPRYRGRSVLEWSVLHGDPTGVTTFFMDAGIDTGPGIVLREPVALAGAGSVAAAKQRLFALDAEMYARALRELRRPGFELLEQAPADGTRWYEMSRLLTGVVDDLLANARHA